MGTTCGCHPVDSLGGFQFVLSLGVKVLAGMSSVTRNYMGMSLECSENVGCSKPINASFNSTGGSIQHHETCNQSLSASYDYTTHTIWTMVPSPNQPKPCWSSAPTLPFLRWAAVVKLRRLVSPGFIHHTTPLHSRPFCQALAPGTQVLIPPVQTSNHKLEQTPVFAGFFVWKTQTLEVCRFKLKKLVEKLLGHRQMERWTETVPTSQLRSHFGRRHCKIYSGTIQVNQVKQVNQVNHWIPRFFKKNAKQLWEVESWIQYLKMHPQSILCI